MNLIRSIKIIYLRKNITEFIRLQLLINSNSPKYSFGPIIAVYIKVIFYINYFIIYLLIILLIKSIRFIIIFINL